MRSVGAFSFRSYLPGNPEVLSFELPGRRRLWAWFLVVTLEHGRSDFATVRPLPTALPGMGLIAVQPISVGLHDFIGLQEQQADAVRGRPHNKSFGFVERRAFG
jgi:hypothetical protein